MKQSERLRQKDSFYCFLLHKYQKQKYQKNERKAMIDNVSRASFDQKEQNRYYSSKNKRPFISKRKLRINQRMYENRNSQYSSTVFNSHLKSPNSVNQTDTLFHKQDPSVLNINHFIEKYLPRGMSPDNLCEEMENMLERKVNELLSVRIYRDELKFISSNLPLKIGLNCLKAKVEVEEKINSQIFQLQHFSKEAESEAQMVFQYSQILTDILKQPPKDDQIIDMSKQQQIVLNNLELETNHFIKELADQKRRNLHQLRQIQEQIHDLRIVIKQKEDMLRDFKAKICTLYIKLHNRNNSRNGSKSKQRNLSMSIKKFNHQNHVCIKEAFIGNNQFKNYSRQLVEKVASDEQLLKLKFFYNGKDNLTFQCLYKSRQGLVHSFKENSETDNEATRDKMSLQQNDKIEQVFIKYLFSIKFYFKSSIVGVQYRAKTEKGNKHIQIGNCNPNIEHELLTLINKQVVTLGSFWHGKQMIGISVWYSDKQMTHRSTSNSSQSTNKKNPNHKKSLKSFDQYYV